MEEEVVRWISHNIDSPSNSNPVYMESSHAVKSFLTSGNAKGNFNHIGTNHNNESDSSFPVSNQSSSFIPRNVENNIVGATPSKPFQTMPFNHTPLVKSKSFFESSQTPRFPSRTSKNLHSLLKAVVAGAYKNSEMPDISDFKPPLKKHKSFPTSTRQSCDVAGHINNSFQQPSISRDIRNESSLQIQKTVHEEDEEDSAFIDPKLDILLSQYEEISHKTSRNTSPTTRNHQPVDKDHLQFENVTYLNDEDDAYWQNPEIDTILTQFESTQKR